MSAPSNQAPLLTSPKTWKSCGTAPRRRLRSYCRIKASISSKHMTVWLVPSTSTASHETAGRKPCGRTSGLVWLERCGAATSQVFFAAHAHDAHLYYAGRKLPRPRFLSRHRPIALLARHSFAGSCPKSRSWRCDSWGVHLLLLAITRVCFLAAAPLLQARTQPMPYWAQQLFWLGSAGFGGPIGDDFYQTPFMHSRHTIGM